MATKIVTKNSSTASAVPTASDLVQGELAVNVADKRLFTEDNGGSIVELGTNPSTIDINAGSIDGTAIGASSASTGAFTTLTATGLTVDTDTLYVDSTNNRVGIGTTSPDADVHISSAGNDAKIILESSANPRGNFIACEGADDLVLAADEDNLGASSAMKFRVDASERMRIDSSGNVGIGVANGDVTNDGNASRTYVGIIGSANRGRLNIGTTASNGADAATLAFTNGTNVLSEITVDTNSGVQNSGKMYINSTDFTSFGTAGSERMRIDSSGDLIVGGTSSGANDAVSISNSGYIQAIVNGDTVGYFNRRTSDGEILRFQKDGTTVGSISTYSGNRIAVGNGDTNLAFLATSDAIIPAYQTSNRDNAIDLGHSSVRFDDIYATNGTIQTSDRNDKQDIAELSDAEQRVAVAAKGLLRKFRWKDSVAEKGDDARIHFGIIAQDLQAAFEAEGLDAGDYAMFISTTWTDEETNEEKTRMGVRYSELLAFIISAI